MAPQKKKVTGSLNSKTPNPYEIAYKELWDKLPKWKKESFAEENSEDRMTDLHRGFIESVDQRAKELYAKI